MYENIQMPFIDPVVGAVSTRQNVYLPKTSIWRRVADWIIDLRYYDYAPAMGRFGGVICASGRTSAYRTPSSRTGSRTSSTRSSSVASASPVTTVA